MRARNAVPWLIILSVVGALGLVAWMTQHPESIWLERAESFPLAGRLVTRFRRTYLPPPARPSEAAEAEGDSRPISVIPIESRAETVWARPGTTLHRAPDRTAAVVGEIDRYASLTAFERRPDRQGGPEERPASWFRVLHGSGSAWVRIEEPEPGEPPLGREPLPVKPVPSLPPDPQRLSRALDLLDPRATPGQLGPYPLYTDVEDAALLTWLGAIADAVEPVYRQRYGREPLGRPAEVVVLFSQEADYRSFQRAEEALAGLPAAGQAGHGVVAFFQGQRQREEVAATLVHEIGHLLNRRALGPLLPAWLDEGIAEDLAWSRITPSGRLEPGTFGGLRLQEEERIVLFGGLAVLSGVGRLAESLDEGFVRNLEDLIDLSWEDFVRSDRQVNYRQAGLLIRFLLDPTEGSLPKGFHAFLEATAAGQPIDAESLGQALGLPWEELELRYRRWLGELAAAAGEELAVDPATLDPTNGSSSRHAASPPA